MGELSQQIGKKLENYGEKLFVQLGWTIIEQNLSIPCTRSTHKSSTSKSGDKTTHGIDILCGYYNPHTKRKEAVLIECKNHLWADFIPSKLNQWVEELVNTIECSSISPIVNGKLGDYIITSAILMYNSSDNLYDTEKANRTMSQIITPKRKSPINIFIADTNKLEKWYSLCMKLEELKRNCPDSDFNIVYPSICGSEWTKDEVVNPTFLFSDYLITTHTEQRRDQNGIVFVTVKSIFSFDGGSEDSMYYLLDMINELQLESHTSKCYEVDIYFYPNTKEDIEEINVNFKKHILETKAFYRHHILDNRRLNRVDYE